MFGCVIYRRRTKEHMKNSKYGRSELNLSGWNWNFVPALWWSWALRWFSPHYCLWTSCLCQTPGYAGSPPSEPGGSGHSAFAPAIKIIIFTGANDTWCEPPDAWGHEEEEMTQTNSADCRRWYLKDAPKGPGAQMVQYGVTTDDLKGRPVLVHSLDALPQTVQFFILHHKTHSTPFIYKIKNPPCHSTSFCFIYEHFFSFYSPKPAE